MTTKITATRTTEKSNYVAFKMYSEFTEEQAARFPKFCGIKSGRRLLTIDLTPKVSTGEINERGIKRIRKILDVLDGDFEFSAPYTNSETTLEGFVTRNNI